MNVFLGLVSGQCVQSTPLNEHKLCCFVAVKNHHPGALSDEERISVFPGGVLITASQIWRYICRRREIAKPFSQLGSCLTYNQLLTAGIANHRARHSIKVHSVEAVFPEDVLDVLGVAVGWISQSPADDDSNEKRER